MRAIIMRELTVMTGKRAFILSAVTYVMLLAGFVFAWSDGVPLSDTPSLYGQSWAVNWALLTVWLPWTAARCLQIDRGDGLVLTAALIARRPASLLMAKFVAQILLLALFATTGLPVLILAQRMSAVPAERLLRDLASFGGLPVLAASITLAWVVAVESRLASWLGATSSIASALMLSWYWQPLGLGVGAACALVGGAIAASLAALSDVSTLYLSERHS